jgi:hypothetical protein
MQQFLGSVRGRGSKSATQLGTKTSGMTVRCQGNTSGITVEAHVNDKGENVFRVLVNKGSNGGMGTGRLIATLTGDYIEIHQPVNS